MALNVHLFCRFSHFIRFDFGCAGGLLLLLGIIIMCNVEDDSGSRKEMVQLTVDIENKNHMV